MSRPIVRRITSAVLLLSLLCFAMPAVAAPASRAQTWKAPSVFGSGLLDQVFSWLSDLLADDAPRFQRSREKAGTISTGGSVEGVTASPTKQEHGGMIDPNGGS